MPKFPATWEAEAAGLQFRRILNNLVRHYLKQANKKDRYVTQWYNACLACMGSWVQPSIWKKKNHVCGRSLTQAEPGLSPHSTLFSDKYLDAQLSYFFQLDTTWSSDLIIVKDKRPQGIFSPSFKICTPRFATYANNIFCTLYCSMFP